MKVLIVDDNQDFLDSTAELLEMEGHIVHKAANYDEAKEKVNNFTYDVGLIDMLIGNRNGIEVLKLCQKQKSQARCYMITGHSDDALVQSAINAGARQVLKKPVDWKYLLEKIDESI